MAGWNLFKVAEKLGLPLLRDGYLHYDTIMDWYAEEGVLIESSRQFESALYQAWQQAKKDYYFGTSHPKVIILPLFEEVAIGVDEKSSRTYWEFLQYSQDEVDPVPAVELFRQMLAYSLLEEEHASWDELTQVTSCELTHLS